MPLTTQGFQVSTLPRAPAIPNNIGEVDVKSIYDGVRQGLEAFERVRQAPRSMLLADAEAEAKTAEAPLAARRALALTVGAEQQTPLKTKEMLFQTSPEMQAAELAAKTAKGAPKPLTGIPYLFSRVDALRQGIADHPEDTTLPIALDEAMKKLNEARDIAAGRNATAVAVGAGHDTTSSGNAAMADATKNSIADTNDARIRDLAASVETMKRDLAAAANASAEKRAAMPAKAPPPQGFTALKMAQTSEAAARDAKVTLDAAITDGDPETIAAAQAAFDEATGTATAYRKEYELYHAERAKKTDDSVAKLAAAFAARNGAKSGTGPAPAAIAPVPAPGEWTEVTLPSGVKVRVRKKP